MQTIKELVRVPKQTGDVGIEIEVEGHHLPTNELGYWRREADGSLRGESAEYVLRKPLSLEAASKALGELDKAYKECKSSVDNSIRAGVHVHVNVQHMTVNQLINFVVTYLIVEDVLVKWCGKSREGNLFCLRCKDAEAWLQSLEVAISTDNLTLLHSDLIRYSSINLKSLCQYGSVEFRAMRGTRDLDKILIWAELLVSIRELACSYENPMKLMEDCLGNVEQFVGKVLGKHFDEFYYEGYLTDVNKAIRYANDVAHYSTWQPIKKKFIGELTFPENVMFPDEPLEDF